MSSKMRSPFASAGQLQRLADLLAAGRRVLARGAASSINRSRAITILREAAQFAKALRADEAYINAVCDLAGILTAPTRVSPADAAEAIDRMSDAVSVARNIGDPSLGLLLTNLAECRMRASRDRDSLGLALGELNEALPLRSSDLDRAYTLANLARVLSFLPEDDPDARISNWNAAISYYERALATFRGLPNERDTFATTVVNLADLVERMVSLDRALRVANSMHGERSENSGTPNSMREVDLVYGLWDLAQVNPSLLDGSDIADALTSVETAPMSQSLIQKARDTMDLLAEVQDSESTTSRVRWSAAQFRAASIEERLIGTATVETARRREVGLKHCPVESDPEHWCTWASAAMTSYNQLGDVPKAIEIGLKAVEAYILTLRQAPDPSDQRELAETFHYLGRRLAFLLLSTGDARRALNVLNQARGRSRLSLGSTLSPVDHPELSERWPIALVYLVAGPSATYFLAVDSKSSWEKAILCIDSIGGKELIGLLMNFSPNAPGLLGAQNLARNVLQESLNNAFQRLSPLMTALHEWLERLGVGDVALVPTGPYSMLPLANVPVETLGTATPFGWLHRCTTLPSAVSPPENGGRRDPIRSIVLAGEAIRPAMEKLRTRSECESIRSLSTENGWTASLLLGRDVTSERLLKIARPMGILHYAGHALTDLVQPEATVLCLTDGDLNLTRFLDELTTEPQIMVLSACQTGQFSFMQAPDENLGFASVAIDKGVAVVVGSLWPVADRETAKFMKELYRSLFKKIDEVNEVSGLIVAEALAQAQRASGAPDYTLSRHWAAFQVFGL